MTAPFPVVETTPALTTDQMRAVDRVMVDDLGIGLIQMMEHAGAHLARLALALVAARSVTVLAGRGGNGGGGLAAARHLANRGVGVSVTLARSDLDEVPGHQRAILERMGVPFSGVPQPADLIIDALVGYSISGDPRAITADLIEWANEQDSPVLALDVPSGLDPATGIAGRPTVTATATMTLALPKAGLAERPDLVGDLFLADISVPPSVYRRFGIDLQDPFQAGGLVRVSALR